MSNVHRALLPASSKNTYCTVDAPSRNVSPGIWVTNSRTFYVTASVAVGGVQVTVAEIVPVGTVSVMSLGQPVTTGRTVSGEAVLRVGG